MKINKLRQFYICPKAKNWLRRQPDAETAWQKCHRGDWMLYIAQKLKIDDRKLTLTKYYIANQARHLMRDEICLKALDAAYKYGIGEIDKEGLYSVYIDINDIHYYDGVYTCPAAAVAACVVAGNAFSYSVVVVALCTADAIAEDATNGHNYNIYDIIRSESLKQSADICRRYLTEEVLDAYNNL